MIDENPFCDVAIPHADVKARQRYVPKESIKRLIEIANPSWQAILGLARYGGLRCPSEVVSLRWDHINWAQGRITVPSPKTERYGKGTREIPLFPDLKSVLTQVRELQDPGNAYVVGDACHKSCQDKGAGAT